MASNKGHSLQHGHRYGRRPDPQNDVGLGSPCERNGHHRDRFKSFGQAGGREIEAATVAAFAKFQSFGQTGPGQEGCSIEVVGKEADQGRKPKLITCETEPDEETSIDGKVRHDV